MSPFTLQLESKTLSYDRQDFLSVEQRLDVSKQLEGFSNLPDFSNKKKEKAFFHLDALPVYKCGKYSRV